VLADTYMYLIYKIIIYTTDIKPSGVRTNMEVVKTLLYLQQFSLVKFTAITDLITVYTSPIPPCICSHSIVAFFQLYSVAKLF